MLMEIWPDLNDLDDNGTRRKGAAAARQLLAASRCNVDAGRSVTLLVAFGTCAGSVETGVAVP
jgi:hypothetical protein